MSGAVTPDHYVIRRDGRVRKAQVHEQPYAIVLEGHDALFMKSGQEPLSCTR